MTSFLKSKLKGSSKTTPSVSNQSSFSDPVVTDDEFHDASEEVSRMRSAMKSLLSSSATPIVYLSLLMSYVSCPCACCQFVHVVLLTRVQDSVSHIESTCLHSKG